MGKKTTAITWAVCVLSLAYWAWGEIPVSGQRSADSVQRSAEVVTISVEQQHKSVVPNSQSALAIHFELAKDWHFYASAKTAPGGMNLKIKPSAEGYINFSEPIFPKGQLYFDKSSGKKLEVFSDKFTVFLPFSVVDLAIPNGSAIQVASGKSIIASVEVGIEGAVCSDVQCRAGDFGKLSTEIYIIPDAPMGEPKFILPHLAKLAPVGRWMSYPIWSALGIAFVAGLLLNIMPCVWPVLPIIVMRLVEQRFDRPELTAEGAKQSKSRSVAMGLAFCLGMLLFFASLAAANIVLQVFYGTVLQWGDQFRSPAFVAGMAFLLVALAMFCFGVFTIGVPSSIAGKSGSGEGYWGAALMGFLAAILSTPCSFAILATAFAWAQAQPLPLGTLAIMIIGVGMALPYAILTSMPGLLRRLPRAGRWMELFKQAIGFVLLVIAVKLVSALPEVRRTGVLYFSVVLGFCVWMWSSWVDYNTKLSRKWLIRIIAVVLVVAAGWLFLSGAPLERIAWQKYDGDVIEKALSQGQPVLIKFTADWCLSCQVVESRVYRREDIGKLIGDKKVLAIKADTTVKDYPATLALKDVYNEPGVPVSILFVPGEKEPIRWHSMSFADELKTRLEELPSK